MVELKILNITSVVIALILLSACYTPNDGCTDIYASNYDASADQHCCCNYPSVKYTCNLIVDSVRYDKDTIFHDVNNRPFYVNKFILAASDIQLEGINKITFTDTIRNVNTPDIIIPKIVILDDKEQSYNLREQRNITVIKKEILTLGMPDEINRIPYEKIPSSNVLDKYEILYDTLNNIWYDGIIDIYPDTSSTQRYRLYLEDIDIGTVMGETIYKNEIGGNLSIKSELNMSAIFKGIDLNEPNESQVEFITNRLSQSLYFKE